MPGLPKYSFLPARLPVPDTTRILLMLIPLLLPLMVLPVQHMIFLSKSGEISRMETNAGRLEKMLFTANAFSHLNFTRSQREFIYRGNMYDIHSITRTGDQVVVLVLWDQLESSILQASQVQDKQEGSPPNVLANVGFMPYFYLDPFNPRFFDCSSDIPCNQSITVIYSDPVCRIPSPPPEILS